MFTVRIETTTFCDWMKECKNFMEYYLYDFYFQNAWSKQQWRIGRWWSRGWILRSRCLVAAKSKTERTLYQSARFRSAQHHVRFNTRGSDHWSASCVNGESSHADSIVAEFIELFRPENWTCPGPRQYGTESILRRTGKDESGTRGRRSKNSSPSLCFRCPVYHLSF